MQYPGGAGVLQSGEREAESVKLFAFFLIRVRTVIKIKFLRTIGIMFRCLRIFMIQLNKYDSKKKTVRLILEEK